VQQKLPSLLIPDWLARQYAEEDWQRFLKQLARGRPAKAVPRWSMRSEVWKLLLTDDDGPLTALFKELLFVIRKYNAVPSLWNYSQATAIPKHNFKAKCAGLRLIHLLEPVSKLWFTGLWKKPHRRIDNADGFISGRGREDSILQVRATRRRLKQLQLSWILCSST
jgi:hypothetical protein